MISRSPASCSCRADTGCPKSPVPAPQAVELTALPDAEVDAPGYNFARPCTGDYQPSLN